MTQLSSHFHESNDAFFGLKMSSKLIFNWLSEREAILKYNLTVNAFLIDFSNAMKKAPRNRQFSRWQIQWMKWIMTKRSSWCAFKSHFEFQIERQKMTNNTTWLNMMLWLKWAPRTTDKQEIKRCVIAVVPLWLLCYENYNLAGNLLLLLLFLQLHQTSFSLHNFCIALDLHNFPFSTLGLRSRCFHRWR